jgi:hypothetical protein
MSPYAFTQLRRFFLPTQSPQPYANDTASVAAILRDPTNKVDAFGQDTFLVLP